MYLDIVTLVIITAFAEKSVVYNTVDVKLVKKWITVLCLLVVAFGRRGKDIPLTRTR